MLNFIAPFLITMAFASTPAPQLIRWTGAQDSNGSLEHIVEVLNQKLNQSFTLNDFSLEEDRPLAFTRYQRLAQKVSGLTVRHRNIRIWTQKGSNQLVQIEALLENTSATHFKSMGSAIQSVNRLQNKLSAQETLRIARASVLADHDDPYVKNIGFKGSVWKDQWQDGAPVRSVRIKGKRGDHFIVINLVTHKVMEHKYREFPQQDFTIPVQVFQIYEEAVPGQQLPRIPALLKNLRVRVADANGDIYAPLKTQRYFESKLDPVLGETAEGRANGYWAPRYLKEQASQIRATLGSRANTFEKGFLLEGHYASINVHPDAITAFAPLSFEPQFSSSLLFGWIETQNNGEPDYEMVPTTAYAGKPIYSLEEAWNRPARRLADHSPREYINDGFDEIQVYYGINTLLEELRPRGFNDPELSTRKFSAFLYNPDITMRDNAYYTDDTINFTTYAPQSDNAARNNTTIWHELGHGIMDRMMGDHLELADTGGLSEGMADFIAQIVVQAVTQGNPYPGSDQARIINHTGFFLTNEVHDDGEAYGGAMNDFMMAVIEAKGLNAKNKSLGLDQVTDLVFEGMRLTRDHPGLTAAEWFSHLLFADSLGRPGLREPGELGPYLLSALASRNFKLEGGTVAQFDLKNKANQETIEAGKPGSRGSPIRVEIPADSKADFAIEAAVKNSDSFAFKFPVQVKVQLRGGPIQGAIKWTGAEIGEEAPAKVYTLNSEADLLSIPLQVSGTCDEINREDQSCVDFAYILLFNDGEPLHPVAKKRFYLRVKSTP